MTTVVSGDFEWDAAKAEANLAKHGVSFDEAAAALTEDDNEVARQDFVHAGRALSLAMSPLARVLLVVTTETTDRTRIISARKASKNEQRAYSRR